MTMLVNKQTKPKNEVLERKLKFFAHDNGYTTIAEKYMNPISWTCPGLDDRGLPGISLINSANAIWYEVQTPSNVIMTEQSVIITPGHPRALKAILEYEEDTPRGYKKSQHASLQLIIMKHDTTFQAAKHAMPRGERSSPPFMKANGKASIPFPIDN